MSNLRPRGSACLLAGLALAFSVSATVSESTRCGLDVAIGRADAAREAFFVHGDEEKYRNSYQQLSSAFADAERCLRTSGDERFHALALVRQARILQRALAFPLEPGIRREDQRDAALATYARAIEAARRAGPVADAEHAEAATWSASLLLERSDHGAAMASALAAVRLATRVQRDDLLAAALEMHGSALSARGLTVEANSVLDRAVEVAQRSRDAVTLAYALMASGNALHRAGSLYLDDLSADADGAELLLGLALKAYNRSVETLNAGGYVWLASRPTKLRDIVQQRLDLTLMKRRRYERLMLGTSNMFSPKSPGNVLVSEVFVFPGRRGEPGSEELERLIAAQLAKTDPMLNQYGIVSEGVRLLAAVGDMLAAERADNIEAARDHALRALEMVEAMRGLIPDVEGRQAVLDDNFDVYFHATRHLLQARRHADAFATLERSRSRALLDSLAGYQLDPAEPEEVSRYAEWRELSARQAELHRRLLESQLVAARTSAAEYERLQADLSRLRAGEQALLQRMQAGTPRLGRLLSAPVSALADVQRELGASQSEMVQYLVHSGGIHVWHIGPDSVTVRQVFLPRSELARKTDALARSLGTPMLGFDEVAARELYLYLVQPIADRIKSRRLIVVPHRNLNGIPFQALVDPARGTFVGERLEVVYAQSASQWLSLRQVRRLADASLVVIADPNIDGDEWKAVAAQFDAQRRRVVSKLPRPPEVAALIQGRDVVHLSVHGVAVSKSPDLSGLKLAPGPDDEGLLSAASMFGLPLKDTRLVVLSACSSGKPGASISNEPEGMLQGLLYAGAGAVVVSTWVIEASPTALWMESFYKSARERPLSEAAQAAESAVRSMPQFAHPHYWAAFRLMAR